MGSASVTLTTSYYTLGFYDIFYDISSSAILLFCYQPLFYISGFIKFGSLLQIGLLKTCSKIVILLVKLDLPAEDEQIQNRAKAAYWPIGFLAQPIQDPDIYEVESWFPKVSGIQLFMKPSLNDNSTRYYTFQPKAAGCYAYPFRLTYRLTTNNVNLLLVLLKLGTLFTQMWGFLQCWTRQMVKMWKICNNPHNGRSQPQPIKQVLSLLPNGSIVLLKQPLWDPSYLFPTIFLLFNSLYINIFYSLSVFQHIIPIPPSFLDIIIEHLLLLFFEFEFEFIYLEQGQNIKMNIYM